MEITKQETLVYKKIEYVEVKLDDKRTAKIEKWNGYDEFDYDSGMTVMNEKELNLTDEEKDELDDLLFNNN